MKHLKIFELFDSEELKTSITKGRVQNFKRDIEQMGAEYFGHRKVKKMGDEWDEYWHKNMSIDSKLDTQEVLNQQVRKTIPVINKFEYKFTRDNGNQSIYYTYRKAGVDFEVDIELTIIKRLSPYGDEYSIFFMPGVADVEDTRSDMYRINNYEEGREENDHERNTTYHDFIKEFNLMGKKATDETLPQLLQDINDDLIKITGYVHAELGFDLF